MHGGFYWLLPRFCQCRGMADSWIILRLMKSKFPIHSWLLIIPLVPNALYITTYFNNYISRFLPWLHSILMHCVWKCSLALTVKINLLVVSFQSLSVCNVDVTGHLYTVVLCKVKVKRRLGWEGLVSCFPYQFRYLITKQVFACPFSGLWSNYNDGEMQECLLSGHLYAVIFSFRGIVRVHIIPDTRMSLIYWFLLGVET